MKLANRNAIITGASVGLGHAIARQFVREGANVLLCARTMDALVETQRHLRESCAGSDAEPSGIHVQACDVSSEEEVHALFARADALFPGPLHILVNNAGVYGPKGPSDEVSLDEWRRCVDINLFGTLIPCREAMRRFKKTGGGKIINLSGGGATNPMPNISAYAASKAAVVRLTETLALEMQPFGVDVNSVAPGALNTRLLDEVIEAGPEKVGMDFYQKSLRQVSEGGVPLELGAELCAWLASDESTGITGKLLSAKWDPWKRLPDYKTRLQSGDIYTLRRITPEDRGQDWPLD